MSSRMARAQLVGVGGQVPVQRDEPAARPQRGPGGPEAPPGRRAGGARTGSRPGRPRSRGRRPDVALLDRDPVRRARPPRRWRAPGRRSRARTRRPSRRVPGKRRAIAISQRPPPQWMSTIMAPSLQVDHELRQRRQRPPGRTPRCPGPSGARSPSGSGPGATASGLPLRKMSGRPAKSRLPMAAWRNWPPRYSGRSASSRIAGDVVGQRRSGRPRARRGRATSAPHAQCRTSVGVRPGPLGQLVRREALGTGVAQRREQPQLEARRTRTTCGRSRRG